MKGETSHYVGLMNFFISLDQTLIMTSSFLSNIKLIEPVHRSHCIGYRFE